MTLTSELDDHRVEYGLQFWMCEDPPDTPDSLSETISQYTVKNANTAVHVTQGTESMNQQLKQKYL